jgi:pimeloyl-ACP methyl ester carboxylesterase
MRPCGGAWTRRRLGGGRVVLTAEMLDALATTAAGKRVRWVLERLVAVGAGAAPPDRGELEEQYTSAWLSEVPVSRTFDEIAPFIVTATALHDEVARPNAITTVLALADGSAVRVRLAVEATPPHRIAFQLVSPALEPSACDDRTVRRAGRTVHIRDYGGTGPLLLLWHGAGCDATVWEAMIPSLRSFARVVAQDLPGHGASPLRRLSVRATLADTRAVLVDLGREAPIVVGHSMGGWIALHYAATSPCRALVCLDGPTNLDYAAMGVRRDHPGWMPDPPDVRSDLASLACPAIIALCRGPSADDAKWMVPFRAGLYDHLATHYPEIRVLWQSTGHMNVLSMPHQTAELIEEVVSGVTA